MTELQDDVEDTRTYPAETWVRTIEFVDHAPEDGTRAPVHVTNRVRINGTDVARLTMYPDTENDPRPPIALKGLRIRNDLMVMVFSNGGLTRAEMLVYVARNYLLSQPGDSHAEAR